MKFNKLFFWFIFLAIIAMIILLVLFRNNSPFGKGNSLFCAEPKKEITKIEFSQDEQKLILQRYEDCWMINGKSKARKSGIQFLLRVIKEIKIKSPVSSEMYKSEISDKNIMPVRVKVFENKRLLKTMIVYKTSSNIYGNIMKLKGSDKAFIVFVPGLEGDVGSVFDLDEHYWRPYTVFNLLPSEIASVKLENFADTASSFSITKSKHCFILSGAVGRMPGWDTSRIHRYISYFAWVPFESWASGLGADRKKAIDSRQPLYRIIVKTALGNITTLTLWSKEPDKRGGVIDSDRLFGKTGESDEFFILRYFDIDPLIKKRSYFFPE